MFDHDHPSRHPRPTQSSDTRPRGVSPAAPAVSADLLSAPTTLAPLACAVQRESPHSDQVYSHDADEFLYETFALTRSRVLLLAHPQLPLGSCLEIMSHQTCSTTPSAYTVRKDWPGKREEGVWIVCGSHEEATNTLSLANPRFAHLAPALETDLEPFSKLQCVAGPPRQLDMLHTIGYLETRDTPPRSPLGCSTPSSATSSEYAGVPRTPLSATYNNAAYKTHDGKFLSARRPLSSNPPNPKVTYRAGDWMCPAAGCGAHNFGRNMACIACGNPRCNAAASHGGPCLSSVGGLNHYNAPSPLGQQPLGPQQHMNQHQHHVGGQQQFAHPQQQQFISPRFLAQHAEDRQRRPLAPLITSGARFAAVPPRGATSLPASRSASRNTSPARSPTVMSPRHSVHPLMNAHGHGGHLGQQQQQQHHHHAPHGNAPGGYTMGAKPHAPTYPVLTPSGHALASSGHVRNISQDPSSPCIMYWPDNEPLPDVGQIRPLGSAVGQYPPIVNTGNKGAAEKQPGDWVCSKCNYLNWRRRKVCQTCYPYAEGNGDSISQAVQAERIALLTNLLNQTDTLALSRRASAPMHAQPTSSAPRHVAPAPRHAASSVDLRRAYEREWEVQDRRRAFDEDSRSHFEGLVGALDLDGRRNGLEFEARPIYQTPLHSRGASPAGARTSPTSAFLPSCLDDVISSPYDTPSVYHDAHLFKDTHHGSAHGHGSGHGHSSPATSASSAELSFDEFPAFGYSGRLSLDSQYSTSGSSSRFDLDSARFDRDTGRFDLDSRRSVDSLRDDYARSSLESQRYDARPVPRHEYAYDAPEDLRFRAPGGATRSGRRPSPRASSVWGESTNYSVIGSEAAFGVKSPEGAIPTDHIAISNPDSAWNLDGDESKTLLARAPIHADEVRELVGRFGRGLDLVTSA